jgi:hypothetical protein
MNQGTTFERLGRLALAAGLVAVAASAALAGSPPGQLTLVDPFVAYDAKASSAASQEAAPTILPAAVTIAAEIEQPVADAVTAAACEQPMGDCAMDGCGDSCECGSACGTSNNCCPPGMSCRPDRRWFAGAETTFLIPDFNNGGFADFTLIDNYEGFDPYVGGVPDMHDMRFGPRVWVGAKEGWWGVVGRFWYLSGDKSERDPYVGIEEGDIGFDYSADFRAYTADLEVIGIFHCCKTEHILSFGVRYASIESGGRLWTMSDTADGVFVTNANYRQMAHGTGFTSALTGTRQIGCTRVNVFYSLRGSLLWGPTDTYADAAAATGGTVGMASAVDGAATCVGDKALLIGEVQFGLQIDHRLECVPADAFFRVAGEYQHWNANKGRSYAGAFVGYGPVLAPTSEAITYAEVGGVEADLFGFSIAAGITW